MEDFQKLNDMKILITGGHFSPAYSVIQKLKNDNILVAGRKYAFEGDKNETLEYRVCKELKIPFVEIDTARLQRKITKKTIPSILRFPNGLFFSFKILREFKPDVVVTFGGYVGLPIALVASILKIPIILHEQTQKAGLASRIISKFATIILISFPSSEKYFKNKNIVLTGNPIRSQFFESQDKVELNIEKPFIYIAGGSTGSHAINELVMQIIPELLGRISVIHQSGNSIEFLDYEKLEKMRMRLPDKDKEKYLVRQFFSEKEVSYIFQNAKFVISRAGINTVLELIATGTRAILIPLTSGQKNEQKENAELFTSMGLGKYEDQNNLNRYKLLVSIHDMINNIEKYKLINSIDQFIFKDASEKIVSIIHSYGRKEKYPSKTKT